MSFIAYIILEMFSFFFRFQASTPFQFERNSFHVMLFGECSFKRILLLCGTTYTLEADLTTLRHNSDDLPNQKKMLQ